MISLSSAWRTLNNKSRCFFVSSSSSSSSAAANSSHRWTKGLKGAWKTSLLRVQVMPLFDFSAGEMQTS